MEAIKHRFGIKAPIAEVYDQVATPSGIARWWTTDLVGEEGVGSKFSATFGAPDRFVTMEIEALTPESSVCWRCIEGPQEWIGTTFTFDLHRVDDETVVMFRNAEWRASNDFMYHCSMKWASFFLGMKAGLEGGSARPFPDDLAISSWDG